MNHKRTVTILRTLRDGTQTVDYLPAWLADLVMAVVPEETNTASARLIDGIHVIKPIRQDWREIALRMAGYTMLSNQVMH